MSLFGAIGFSRSDALLNLQLQGASAALGERKASNVSRITNADGSRTYVVDLRGVAVGTAVNLSFDLIGFGKSANQLHSHVTVRDVRMLGAAQTVNDSVTTSEDTVTQIIAIANDIDAVQEGFAPVVVAAPSHGVVVVNADGTFSYTPALNYYGSDSFTYKISNGQVDSNVSTVSITVTPVNDIPVAASLSVSTLEDTALTLDLLAQASEVEGSTLTVSIVTGPAHGALALNADGSYTYTPNADYHGADSFTYRVNDGDSSAGSGQGLDSALATVNLTVTPVNDTPVNQPAADHAAIHTANRALAATPSGAATPRCCPGQSEWCSAQPRPYAAR